MNVQDLIDELQKLPDKTQRVTVYGTGELEGVCTDCSRYELVMVGANEPEIVVNEDGDEI